MHQLLASETDPNLPEDKPTRHEKEKKKKHVQFSIFMFPTTLNFENIHLEHQP